MVRVERFELPTSWSQARRAATALYPEYALPSDSESPGDVYSPSLVLQPVSCQPLLNGKEHKPMIFQEVLVEPGTYPAHI